MCLAYGSACQPAYICSGETNRDTVQLILNKGSELHGSGSVASEGG